MTIHEILELLRKQTLMTEGKFEDVLLAQLGKLGQIALDLEAISVVNPDKATELAQALDTAQASNDAEQFNRLVQQAEMLATEARNL